MLSVGDFKWSRVHTLHVGAALVCMPETGDGRAYPYELSVWPGGLLGWLGEIDYEGETISFSESDVLTLIGKMEQRVMRLDEG